jgi:hypothetical protein
MPDQMGYVALGALAEVLFWSPSVMVQNGIRLTAANPGYANIKLLNAAVFPNGSFNVVVTGRLNPYAGKSVTLASGANTVTCPIDQAPWRCVITLPVGVIGQQQQVSMTSNTTTLLDAISVE